MSGITSQGLLQEATSVRFDSMSRRKAIWWCLVEMEPFGAVIWARRPSNA